MHDVVSTLHQVMEEVCESPPSIAHLLFQAVRSGIVVVKSVIPARHGSMIAAVPRLSALFHNDCLYLAHHAVTLVHAYRSRSVPFPAQCDAKEAQYLCSRLPKSFEGATLVDCIPGLRTLAQNAMVWALRKQRSELLEYLSEGSPSLAQLETAINRQRHQLSLLSSGWRDVLPKEQYQRVMKFLVSKVIEVDEARLSEIEVRKDACLELELLLFETGAVCVLSPSEI